MSRFNRSTTQRKRLLEAGDTAPANDKRSQELILQRFTG
jgi:hypothetical protein